MFTRTPVVAGQFYPSVKSDLEKTLSSLTRKNVLREKAVGAIVPHAGYTYSGSIAGEVFSRVMPRKLFIIIGPNHTGRGKPFSISGADHWRTPLGNVTINSQFGDLLTGRSSLFKKDESAHNLEHSVEVQLPFLQYLMSDFNILPVSLASEDLEDLKKASAELAKAITDSKSDATIIASTDMTHYEPDAIAKAKDKEALASILKMDEISLWKKVNDMNISMCGAAPVIMMISAAKELGANTAELIGYKTSAETSGDYLSVVGYAGALLK